MKKPARQLIKESLEKQFSDSKTQRLYFIYILNSYKKYIEKNLKLYESLVYIIEKHNIEYNTLNDIDNFIKNNNLNDINIVQEIVEMLLQIENITNLLDEKVQLFKILNRLIFLKEKFPTNNVIEMEIEKLYKEACIMDEETNERINKRCIVLTKNKIGGKNE